MAERTLLDVLLSPRPTTPTITIDRSTLQNYLMCALYCILERMREKAAKAIAKDEHEDAYWTATEVGLAQSLGTGPVLLVAIHNDRDANRMRDVGTAFHDVMREYISDLIATGTRSSPDMLADLALAGPARFQPDLLHCAKMTGPKFAIWPGSYISHEKQYAYRLEGYGPQREDVLLTTRPDFVAYGNNPRELRCPDWKSGWGMAGMDFQAMFVALILWKALEDIQKVIWIPLHARKGKWGKHYEFIDGAVAPWEENLADCEAVVKRAVIDYLTEDEWKPEPGYRRCQWCPYSDICPSPAMPEQLAEDPVAFADATAVVERNLKTRKLNIKAYTDAHGPLQTEDGWWGTTVMSQKPTFRLNKGTPDYLGEEELDLGQGDIDAKP